MVLCFGFGAKTVWLTHWCFGCRWAALAQHQGFLFYCSAPPLMSPSERHGGEQEAEKRNSWASWAILANRILHNMVLSNKICSRERRKLGILSFKFSIAQRLAGHWSACGSWWVIAFASLIFFFLFPSCITLCLPQLAGVFLLFLFPFYPLSFWKR